MTFMLTIWRVYIIMINELKHNSIYTLSVLSLGINVKYFT